MKIKVGDMVDYHSLIGGEVTSTGHTVIELYPKPNNFGCDCATITGKSGVVAAAALTHSVEAEKEKVRWYYIQRAGFVGNCLLWWRKGGNGYTCDLAQAELFMEGEQLNELAKNHDLTIWPKQYIDERAALHVDHQRVSVAEAIRKDRVTPQKPPEKPV